MNRSGMLVLVVVLLVAAAVAAGLLLKPGSERAPRRPEGPAGGASSPPVKAEKPPPDRPWPFLVWAVKTMRPLRVRNRTLEVPRYPNLRDQAVLAAAGLPGGRSREILDTALARDADGRYEEVELAAYAYHALAVRGDRGLAPKIAALVKEADDWDVSEWSAKAAGRLREKEGLELLLSLTRDEEENARMEAAVGLARWKDDPRARDAVKALLDDEDDAVAACAAGVLVAFGDPDAAIEIEKILKEDDWEEETALAKGLGLEDGAASLPWLDRLLRNDDEDVRAAAARALGAIRTAEARGRLAKLLSDEDDGVKAAAAAALARTFRDPAGAEILARTLRESPDQDLRVEALRALAVLDRPRDRKLLEQVFADPSRDENDLILRAWAAAALIRIEEGR